MSEQPLDPYQINCYNRCTQMHGPLHHSDMTVSQALCKEDILQDDMVGDRGVSMLASSSGKQLRHKAIKIPILTMVTMSC